MVTQDRAGPASVWSSLWASVRRALRGPWSVDADDSGEALSFTGMLVVAGFLYRALSAPVSATGPLAERKDLREVPLLVLLIAITFAWNIVLAVGTASRRPFAERLLDSDLFFAIDLISVVALTLWNATLVRPGSPFNVYRDTCWVFWVYLIATIAIWTNRRGAVTGLWLVAGSLVIQGILLWNGHREFGSYDLAGAEARVAWAISGWLLPEILILMSRDAARTAAELAASKERERNARALHDNILQTLGMLVSEPSLGPEFRAQLAKEEVWLRRLIDGRSSGGSHGLVEELEEVVQAHAGVGLKVELNTESLGRDPALERVEALAGAVREALSNVRKHACTDRAVVRAASEDSGTRVTVLDHGVGFAGPPVEGFGLRRSIRARIEDVGGRVLVESSPGAGTYIDLWVPA